MRDYFDAFSITNMRELEHKLKWNRSYYSDDQLYLSNLIAQIVTDLHKTGKFYLCTSLLMGYYIPSFIRELKACLQDKLIQIKCTAYGIQFTQITKEVTNVKVN